MLSRRWLVSSFRFCLSSISSCTYMWHAPGYTQPNPIHFRSFTGGCAIRYNCCVRYLWSTRKRWFFPQTPQRFERCWGLACGIFAPLFPTSAIQSEAGISFSSHGRHCCRRYHSAQVVRTALVLVIAFPSYPSCDCYLCRNPFKTSFTCTFVFSCILP